MEVRATKAGFYEVLRQPGDVFHVPDGLRASWFVPVAPDGLNPLEPDNHGLGGELGGDGLNPNGEGLNPEPVWVEPTPAEGLNPTPEVKPESAEKIPENENIFPEKPEEIPENQTVSPETGKGKRK